MFQSPTSFSSPNTYRFHNIQRKKSDYSFDTRDSIPTDHPWVCAFSGGGLRATAASAVFALALMRTRITVSTLATSTTSVDDITSNNVNADAVFDQQQQQQQQQSLAAEVVQSPLTPSSSVTSSVWNLMYRAFGVSGGAWFLVAHHHGVLKEMDETWTIDKLLKELEEKTGIVRSGNDSKFNDGAGTSSSSFDSRTKQIHQTVVSKIDQLPPLPPPAAAEEHASKDGGGGANNNKLVGPEWSPGCCWCPSCCSGLQWVFDCCYYCACCCQSPYLLARVINDSAGEGALAMGNAEPNGNNVLVNFESFIAPIILGTDYCDTNTNSNKHHHHRDADGGNNSNNNNNHTYKPELWVSAISSPQQDADGDDSGGGSPPPTRRVSWAHFCLSTNKRRKASAAEARMMKVILQTPPPSSVSSSPFPDGGDAANSSAVETTSVTLAHPVSLRHLVAFSGSAFCFDAKSLVERSAMRSVATIAPNFPFASPRALMRMMGEGDKEICRVKVEEEQKQKQQQEPSSSNNNSNNSERKKTLLNLRDAGPDVNVSMLALDGFEVAFILDNGVESEFGQQLHVAHKRGHSGEYELIDRDPAQRWGIFIKNNVEERGPAICVYFCGLNDTASMTVRKAADRTKQLRDKYRTWVEVMPTVIERLFALLHEREDNSILLSQSVVEESNISDLSFIHRPQPMKGGGHDDDDDTDGGGGSTSPVNPLSPHTVASDRDSQHYSGGGHDEAKDGTTTRHHVAAAPPSATAASTATTTGSGDRIETLPQMVTAQPNKTTDVEAHVQHSLLHTPASLE